MPQTRQFQPCHTVLSPYGPGPMRRSRRHSWLCFWPIALSLFPAIWQQFCRRVVSERPRRIWSAIDIDPHRPEQAAVETNECLCATVLPPDEELLAQRELV